MERALAFVETSDRAKAIVREAGKLADGVDADLLLLHVTTEEEFNRENDALAGTDFDMDYGIGNAREGARQFARDVGQEVLEEGADFEPVGEVGDPTDVILSVAEREGVDHVFVPGKQRSPTGKALFGDLAQTVILDFDGPVTVITGTDE
jgi:nucleotide-binding universal stress UspA family protein